MMDPDDSCLHATPDGLAQILGLGVGADVGADQTPDAVRACLLKARLAEAVPDAPSQGSRSAPVTRSRALPRLGRLDRLLLSAGTDLSVLSRIKDEAKEASRDVSDTERDVWLIVYFAAIAGALLFHNEKITTHDYADLAGHFGSLIEKRWMAPRLAGQFAEAQKACREATL